MTKKLRPLGQTEKMLLWRIEACNNSGLLYRGYSNHTDAENKFLRRLLERGLIVLVEPIDAAAGYKLEPSGNAQ